MEGIQDGVASSPEKLNKYIRTIYNKANDMDRLIDELTFYSKIDTNKIPYNFSKINVAEYFGDCVEEVGLDMETRGIELGYFNYVDEDVVVIADAEQMKRVINNIIGNSLKYLDKKKGILNIRIKDDGEFYPGHHRGQRKGNRGERSAVYFRPFLPDGLVEKFVQGRQRHRAFDRKEDYRRSRRTHLGDQQGGHRNGDPFRFAQVCRGIVI